MPNMAALLRLQSKPSFTQPPDKLNKAAVPTEKAEMEEEESSPSGVTNHSRISGYVQGTKLFLQEIAGR